MWTLNMSLALQPLEEYMLEGVAQYFAKRFQCMVAYGNSVDRIRTIEKLLAGKSVVYPYAYLSLTSIGHDAQSFHTQTLARSGVPVVIQSDGNQFYRVRLMPALFEFEVAYVTNQMMGTNQRSVLEFQRRWLFVRRQGGLKFSVKYGDLNLRVGLEMSESVPTPTMENKTESTAEYECTSTFTLRGFISEPVLGETGIVKEVNIEEVLGHSAVTIPFPES
ncbi:hypothetical protein [Achromobacter phage Motura]|uniref:Uncharacterized protein n=1 Tax=Achromobacter phage Motura TaxID=2591403 RepID=A0A514CSZ0_9CAUD|nr:hypothetical protein H1O15_gp190 [Achromobacter phage Motura]QDH83598.1 hypothetical protein [Achromobacter phage Motura]